MKKIREKLKGWKTYFICASAIIAAILGFEAEAIGGAEAVAAIIAAIYGIANRAGMKNSSPQ